MSSKKATPTSGRTRASVLHSLSSQHNKEGKRYSQKPHRKPTKHRKIARDGYDKSTASFTRSSTSSTNSSASSKEHPSRSLLKHFDPVVYNKFEETCLKERQALGAGQSPQMNSLYRFLSFHLREPTNFSYALFNTFKKFALEDSEHGFDYGKQTLYRFLSYGLELSFRYSLFEEFKQLVTADLARNDTYGLEKLWAFLAYRKDMEPAVEELGIEEDLMKRLQAFQGQRTKSTLSSPSASRSAPSSSSSSSSSSSCKAMMVESRNRFDVLSEAQA